MQEYLIALCESEVNPSDESTQNLKAILAYFLDMQKPVKFKPQDPENVVMKNESSFEEVVAMMQENGVVNPKEMSEFEFYKRLQYYEKKFQKLNDLHRS